MSFVRRLVSPHVSGDFKFIKTAVRVADETHILTGLYLPSQKGKFVFSLRRGFSRARNNAQYFSYNFTLLHTVEKTLRRQRNSLAEIVRQIQEIYRLPEGVELILFFPGRILQICI